MTNLTITFYKVRIDELASLADEEPRPGAWFYSYPATLRWALSCSSADEADRVLNSRYKGSLDGEWEIRWEITEDDGL